MAGKTAEGEIWHGGDLAAAQALFPDAPAPWLDLSTGINPVFYPLPHLPAHLWQRLPGAVEEAALLAAARQAYAVPERAGIVAAPGTQILIELLPRLLGAENVAVLGPTYAEHAQAWSKAGAQVREIGNPEEIMGAGVVVVVNPNNPDGRIVSREKLTEIAAGCAARGGLLVVDEAFADFTPSVSLVPVLPEGALVLRSFGKTYGLAGLRVGFALGAPALIAGLRAALGPWSVAGPALVVAAKALADEGWLARAAGEARQAQQRLDALLAPYGRVVGGTALFRLLGTPAAPALFEHLGRHGIYVRRFQHDARLLRFGVPGSSAEWARLEATLGTFPTSA